MSHLTLSCVQLCQIVPNAKPELLHIQVYQDAACTAWLGTVEIWTTNTIKDLRYKIWAQLVTTGRPDKYFLWTEMTKGGDGYHIGTFHEDSQTVGSQNFNDHQKCVIWRSRPAQHINRDKFTRILAVQQIFHALINRSIAYDYPVQLGLLTFNSSIKLECPITGLFESFREKLDSVSPVGETRLYDALNEAIDRLTEFSKQVTSQVTQSKAPALRIVCLSDGVDTVSSIASAVIAQRLQSAGVILDAVMIGGEGEDNPRLKALAKTTGGYAFSPSTIENALRICELETVLHSPLRPELQRTTTHSDQHAELVLSNMEEHAELDVCTVEQVPEQRPPANLEKGVSSIQHALDKAAKEEIDTAANTTCPAIQQSNQAVCGRKVKENGFCGIHQHADVPLLDSTSIEAKHCTRRVLLELRRISNNPHPSIDIYPCEDDVRFWRVVMEGPRDDASCPYGCGVWMLYVHFPVKYPIVSPEIRFVTPIRHCNVNPHGRICHSSKSFLDCFALVCLLSLCLIRLTTHSSLISAPMLAVTSSCCLTCYRASWPSLD